MFSITGPVEIKQELDVPVSLAPVPDPLDFKNLLEVKPELNDIVTGMPSVFDPLPDSPPIIKEEKHTILPHHADGKGLHPIYFNLCIHFYLLKECLLVKLL